MSHTIIKLYDNYSDASAAASELEHIGVSSNDISLIANDAEGVHSRTRAGEDAGIGAGAGAAAGGVGGLLAGLGVLAIPGLGPVVAAGWLAATAAGVVAGAVIGGAAGGIVGALQKEGISEEDANLYSEGVRRGGTLVSARVGNSHTAEAEAIMNRYRAIDPATRRAAYRKSGWERFDALAPVYEPDDIARERALYAQEDTRL